jgi:hypothetical protein
MRTPARPARRLLTLAEAEQIEDAWRPETRPDLAPDPARWGAEPYPLTGFLPLLAAAMTAVAVPAPVFCDLGAGPGIMVAFAEAAGCAAFGIELVPAMAEAARRELGVDVRQGDAEATHLGCVHIVYLNQLYRDAAAQTRLQASVCDRMDPAAALILANSPSPPPGWPGRAWPPGAGGPPWAGCWIKPRPGREPADGPSKQGSGYPDG